MFDQYASAIRRLPLRKEYQPQDLLVPDFLIARQENLCVYYAPFDWANTSARVILLGITPGWTQMELAYRAARVAIDAGCSGDDICRAAKLHGAFAGPMRTNLIRMLDEIDLPKAVGVRSAADLFGASRHLLHTASVIRYPVFVASRNYTGSPFPTKLPLLMNFARTVLAPELASVGAAVIVPLGKAVEAALDALANEGLLPTGRWLRGFPHPSGANGHRVRLFAQNRESLREQVCQAFAQRIAS